MPLSDNMRGIKFINLAMLAFTLNDTCMKAVTETLPLSQTIAMRGVLTTAALVVLAMMTSGLRLWPGPRDGRIVALRSAAEVGATLFFFAALLHMPLANLSAIMQSLPLAVTLVASLIFDDPIGWRRLSPSVPSATVAIWASVCVTIMGIVGSGRTGWEPVTMVEALLVLGAMINLVIGYLTVMMMSARRETRALMGGSSVFFDECQRRGISIRIFADLPCFRGI